MTKAAALHSFFSGFGLTAYDAAVVPDDAEFPYLTYTQVIDSWGNPVSLTVNLWYLRTIENQVSGATLNAKVQEIEDALPRYVPYDGGAILLQAGSPFSQSLSDDTDANIRRRYINITAEYLTTN